MAAEAVQPLIGGEGVIAEKKDALSTPEAIEQRTNSATAYEGLSPTEALSLANRTFPSVNGEPDGGLPLLPSGEVVSSFIGPNAASVTLPDGHHRVIESSGPIAAQTSPGTWAGLNLSLGESNGVFVPKFATDHARIPKNISEGVSLPVSGVSLTPLMGSGVAAANAASGVSDGYAVFWGGLSSGSDVDMMAKPDASGGVDLETVLRSQRSPEILRFAVGLPESASLEQQGGDTGPVLVRLGGQTTALILPPVAVDAQGTQVSDVTMSVSGNIITISVPHRAGQYAYPLVVDPGLAHDEWVTGNDGHPTNWRFESNPVTGSKFTSSGWGGNEGLTMYASGSYTLGEDGMLIYPIREGSHVSIANARLEIQSQVEGSSAEAVLELESSSKEVEKELWYPFNSDGWAGVSSRCNEKELGKCPAWGNLARMALRATGTGSGATATLSKATMELSTDGPMEASFNTTESSFLWDNRVKNVFYGSNGWLGPHSNSAFELNAWDEGLGISKATLYLGSWLQEFTPYENGECEGVQCAPKLSKFVSYSSKMPEGETRLEGIAYDTSGEEYVSPVSKTLKVDATPPHNIVLSGLGAGGQIGAGEYHLRAEATDGSGTTPSSGVKSIALQIDGKEVGSPSGGCEPGPCTAHAEWTIAGRNYAVGRHTFALIATDNAGNVAVEDIIVNVRAASSVALSPGSLNLESGEFTLGATDVSMGPGLSVSRSYSSRHLNAGAEGPMGPQWTTSLTGQEHLEEQSNESVVFTGSNGSQAIFHSTSKGVFEAPPGDSNLALSEGEVEGKKAYILTNAASDTKTVFTLPSGGSKVWVPTKQEGPVTTDTTTYKYQTVEGQTEYGLPSGSEPVGIVTGANGNLWFADYGTNKIGKVTTSGTVTEYALPSGSGPLSVATGPDGNVWFTDVNTSKIGKITTSGTITEYSLPSGSAPYTITQGSDGNLWYTDFNTNKIGKITTSGTITEYYLPSGSRPYGITAGPEGNLWFTDWGTSTVGKITTSGTITEYPLPSGSDPHRIVAGTDGNLWLTNTGTNKIAKVTPWGAITEYSVPSGSELMTIAAGPDGNLWFTDELTNKIGKITTSGSITEYPVPSGSGPYGIVAGPDGNLWFTEISAGKIGKIPTSGMITEPTQALAPEPAGVSCTWKEKPTEMKPGCRALEFKYAIGTTAKGETESEWGEYHGRLTKVLAVIYNPSTKIMEEKAVAEYSYDKLGRLRAEWDPRISPLLKTIYGYDAEGHVTALTEPGQESWVFAYGTVAGDSNAGRLFKVTRAPASAKLWKGELPENKEAPKLSGSAVTGATMSVSTGTWVNEPVAYAYQWDDCNAEGADCTPILGATNADYTLAGGDIGHTVIAQVIATNGGGSMSAATSASASVRPEITEYGLPSGSEPVGIVAGPDGNSWFADFSTSKIGKVTTSGTITEYSLPAESGPLGIVSGPDGNLWFTDEKSSKIGKITTSGTVTEYSLPASSNPYTMTVGPDGNLWFTNFTSGKVGKITTSGVITEYSLPSGSQPGAIVAGPDGNLWFSAYGTNKIGKITTSGVITEYSLPSGSQPFRIVAGPDGNLWFTDIGTSKIGKVTTSGTITEYAVPSGSEPFTIVAGPDGNLWFTDIGTSKIGKITTSGTITEYSVTASSEPYGIATGPDGNLWFTEINASKIGKIILNPTEGGHGIPQPGSTIEYNVPLAGTGLPTMSKEAVEKWGQTDGPAEATAIFPPDEPQSWPAGDYKRATISYVDAQGRMVNVSTPSGGISTSEYNTTNDVTRSLSADNRATALKEGTKSAEVAKMLDTQSKYNSEGTELTETLGPRHLVKLSSGKEVQARSHTVYSYDEGAPSEGGPYRLVTKTTQGAQVEGEAEQDIRTTTTSYAGQSNLGWRLRRPTSVTVEPSGLKITHTTLYEEATGNVLETRMPKSPGAESPHDTKNVYYSTAVNTSYPACGEHPEWATLPCETLPGKQPETPGLPTLPVTTVSSYNLWLEPLTASSTSGSATRTTTDTYDAAGRLLTNETTSNVGTALPKVTDKYDEHTGAMTEQSTTTEGKTQSLKGTINTLGQITSYTDADGNTSTYEYETEKDARLKKVNDGKGVQIYEYDETTGAVKELIDSAAGTFTAGYDVEGNMTSENYPNGLKATYTLDAAGETTSLVYKKETHCTENCEWFKDSVVPSIHGQWASQTSSLSKETYAYDGAGRLTEVQATPAGKGCTTRRYAYDEDTNRTSLTTYEPNSKGECSTEKSVVESHTYDSADRLTDTGIGYDAFGNTTSLPAADAGKFVLTSSFYQDNQLQSQTQNGQTIGYNLDPAHRTREIVSTGKIVATEIQHYAAPGSTPAWTGELSGNWTRNISGMSGLSAIQHNGETPILQITNLHGDIVATVADSETATGLASTISEASEYGVPATETPPKYSWLGASEIRTELLSGVSAMGARSYIPQLGRYLQTDPRPGGSANAYAYVYGDPINTTDLSGEWTFETPTWVQEADAGWGAREEQRQIANERAAREEAERTAAQLAADEAAYLAAMAASSPTEGGPELPLGGYAGWECQDAAETGQEAAGCGGSLDVGNQGDFVQCKHAGCPQYCAEHAKSKSEADKCSRGPVGPAEKCITGAMLGALVAWIPGVDIESGEAALAGCAGANGEIGEVGSEKKD